jgi:outer membrane protein insertion porin family
MIFTKRFLSIAIACIAFFISLSFAADGFVVRHIQIVGAERIAPDTVRSYMPFHEGQTFTAQSGDAIIAALYKTGFFTDVELAQRGDALIVHVQERPIISLIQLSGNKEITSDKLRPVLKKMGIVEGDVYDKVKINEISQGLEQQYATMGYRAVTVTANAVPESRNRVALYININEGTVTKVRSIHFVGNHAFSERTLRHQFKLTTRGLFTWINHRDRFSEARLQEDLQNLGTFYLNHGYLRFRIVSQQVTLTPDKTGVAILITVDEGPQYYVSGFTIIGETFGFDNELYPLVTFKKGDPFSRQQVIDSNKAIGDFMADRGYAFANVSIAPNINDVNHMVFVTFKVVPGNRVYVRRINFFGNHRTNEVVLRREMRQFEASSYSLSRIEESKRRLQLLGYLDDINVSTQPVAGTVNQVDLNYHIKEVAAGRASLQGGYSDVYGFLYGASISEPNFMGSGKYVSLGFQNSQYSDYYAFTYNNPYYTPNGMSRGFSVYYSHTRPSQSLQLQSYLMDAYGIDVTYGIPISERNSIGFGYGYENISLSNVNLLSAAPSVLAFLNNQSSQMYNQFKVTGGWTYNGLDRAIFPSKGFYTGLGTEIGVPIVKTSIGYYTATSVTKYYQPLFSGFILNLLGTVAWGDGLGNNQLPFYKNFYTGGIGSVPAFAPNSLGPNDLRNNQQASIGGNLEMLFGAHLILPTFYAKIRTAILLDAGNVFQVPQFPQDIPANGIVQNNSVSLSNLRPSLGVGLEWWSPMGPIDLTLAYPLDHRAHDLTNPFQFSFGVSL